MYKDVWKKFGLKILIIFCSVMLLGGVAVAAPRLQAALADGKPTFAEIEAWQTDSNAVVKATGNLQYNFGNRVIPERIEVKSPDGSYQETLELGRDYYSSGGNNDTNAFDGTNKAIVRIRPEKGSTKIDGTVDKELVIEYEIAKREITDRNCVKINFTGQYKDAPDAGSWVVSGLPAEFKSSDWEIYIENLPGAPQNRIDLEKDKDYEIVPETDSQGNGQEGPYVLGPYDREIALKNYKYSGNVSATVYKHVDSFLCKMNNTSGKLEVSDNGTMLTEGVHYHETDKGDGTILIEGIRNASKNIYYVGTRVVQGSVSDTDISAAIIEGCDSNTLIDYVQNHRTIVKKPDNVYMTNAAGDRIYLNEDVNYTTQFYVVDGTDKLEGATAGTVEVVFTGISPYGGTASRRYGVRRELVPNELSLSLEPEVEGDTFKYDGKSPHIMNPIVTFNDSADYRLRDKDYDVYYSLTANNKNDIAYTKDKSLIKDAGTVYVKIVGKADADQNMAGYYGTLDGGDVPGIKELQYTIDPIDLLKDKYKIELLKDRRPDDLFNVTCSKQDVIDRVYLVSGDNKYPVNALTGNGGDYSVVFKHSSGDEIKNSEWGKLAPGTYTMEFDFHGNFVGKLSAQFRIEEYKDEEITVELEDTCALDGNESEHIYNKLGHEPQIKSIKYKGSELTVINVGYKNNVNAGKDTAIIEITLSGGMKIEREFSIATQALDAGVIQLTSPGFTSGSSIRTHEYCGQKNGPAIPTLTFVPNSGGRSVEIEEGADYKVIGLFDESGNQVVDFSSINTNTKYRYEVSRGTAGNFVNTKDANNPNKKVYTEWFKFTARSINKKIGTGDNERYAITYPTITPMEYDPDNPSTEDESRTHILDNMVLTDAEFGDTLRRNVDYDIESINVNTIGTDGTVTFVLIGKGCYTGRRSEQKVFVGKDIISVVLKEKTLGDRYVNATNREAVLSDLYKQNPGNAAKPFDITFNTTRTPASTEIVVKDGSKIICEGAGNQYLATFDATIIPDPSNPDTGEQYAIATLTGINGYYNSIKVRFRVGKHNLGKDYELIILKPNDYYYTGKPIIPDFVVRKKGTNGEFVGEDGVVDPEFFDVECSRNENATKDYANNSKTGALIVVTGKKGFEGKLEANFEIKPRPINDSNGGLSDLFLMNNFKGRYPYRPVTKFGDETVQKGTWADFELLFDHLGNLNLNNPDLMTLERKQNGDYTYVCLDAEAVTTPNKRAKVVITAQGNFTGTATVEYDIETVDLQDPSITITIVDGDRKPFTGDEWNPELIIEQKVTIDGEERIIDIPESEYTKTPYNARWVSASKAAGQTKETYLLIEPKLNVNGTYNYSNAPKVPFVIYGQFDPPVGTGGLRNSKVEVKIDAIPYSENIAYSKYTTVEFYQKMEGKGDDEYGKDPTNPPRKLTYGDEYYITCNDENETVGIHSGYIRGYDDRLFVGKLPLNKQIIIQGNLSTQAEVTWNRGSNSIPFGKEIKWDEYITVTCGGKDLKYGKDYQIRGGEPTFDAPGEASIVIEPTEEAGGYGDETKAYLIKDKKIDFNVTTQITDDNVSGLETEYIYTGMPVINVNNIIIKYGTEELKYNEDFTVEGDIDAVNAGGPYTIIIKGKSPAFIGSSITHRFIIKPYNIENNENVTIKYDPDLSEPVVTYTGSEALPKVASITVATSSGSLVLTPGDEDHAPDYEVTAAGDGDHVNRTNTRNGKPKPQFTVRGVGNFTGSITREYIIEPRNINDPGVVFDPLEGPWYYDNGKPVTPLPSAKFGTMQLVGMLYNNNDVDKYPDWEDYTKHFTYEYKMETISVGTKIIHITGIGNFIGDKEISFEIQPLDLDKTELRFKSEEAPVYDGEQQRPAFGLWYNGVQILEWTGSKIISDYISTANVAWDYNVEASNEKQQASVTVSLAESGDNYQGSKTRSFMIQPASLASHVKFMHLPEGQNQTVDLNTYKLNLPFVKGQEAVLKFAEDAPTDANLTDGEIGIYYNYPQKANHGEFLGNPKNTKNFTFERVYVEPDTDDVEVREGYGDGKENGKDTYSYAGKIKYTITGTGNYKDSATFWYYIGTDISSNDVTVKVEPKTAVYNSTVQAPEVTVSGVDKELYKAENYKNETKPENRITRKEFIDAANYFIRIEGQPWNGTYASNPQTYTYTITPRPLSNSLVIDGFKKEYPYTGLEIRPIGISVTDYIDRIKYRLTEDLDYTLSYKNNLNAGTAFIEVQAKGNFSGSASANFLITSSTISSGTGTTPDTPINGGTGEISGSTPVSPNNVILTMDTANAMFYTGNAVYPKVSIAGMTENIDYTVTFSNNIEVGVATVTITGIGNNRGTITKTFNIIAPLSKCTIAPIPAQQYTGSPVTPTLTVTCGKNILIPGTDYNVTYSNNVNIGTATVTINAANNSKYTGSAKATFSIGNDVGGFIISGYAPTYTYTGNAITPSVVVETGSDRLTQGTDYTVSYSNNINAGKATITVKGVGKYSGTQTANFMIEAKSITGCDTTEVEDRTYTGDAYTPSITVTDGTKVLTNGVDYTLTYTNNKEPGTASILIQGTSNNYSGTKIVNFKIAAVAVKGLKATNVKYSSLKLKWTKQGYADGYQICDAQSKVIKNVTKNSATISKLSTGKTYRYKVRSYIRNADGTRSYGAFSSVISATTKLKTPVVKVVSKKTGQARISWSKVAGADGYEIYYKKSSKDTYRKLKTVNNANVRICNVRGMKSGDRAYFRVRAFKKNGSKKVYSAMNKLKVITVK